MTACKREMLKLERLENVALNTSTMDAYYQACESARESGRRPGGRGYAEHIDWLMTAAKSGLLILDSGRKAGL